MDLEAIKALDKNFVRLTQTLYRLGTIVKVEEKIFPHGKAFMIKKMRLWNPQAPGSFWYDLHKKNEAMLADKWGDKIHFKIELVDGSDHETYKHQTSQSNSVR